MIINQTTTLIFEYPQDYLQEQEWCKTKEDRWIHKGTDTLGAVYENTISYSIGQLSNSEIPNNSTTEDCSTVKPQNYCDDCLYCDTCDSKEFFYACTSKATISKMEQVDEPKTQMKTQNSNLTFEKADEPQIYGNEYNCIMTMFGDCSYAETGCGSCEVVEKVRKALDEYEPKDEPQTDCAWR